MKQYLAADPLISDLYPAYDERLFVAGLSERTTVEDDQHRIHLELVSSITGLLIPVAAEPEASDFWQRELRAHDDRHRHVTVHAGRTRFASHVEPVTAPGGWQLDTSRGGAGRQAKVAIELIQAAEQAGNATVTFRWWDFAKSW